MYNVMAVLFVSKINTIQKYTYYGNYTLNMNLCAQQTFVTSGFWKLNIIVGKRRSILTLICPFIS